MKGFCLAITLTIIAISAACADPKPDIQTAAMTEPWASMKLPCSGNSVVVNSDQKMFTCAYGGKDDRESVVKAIAPYVEVLKQNGWKIIEDIPEVAVQYQLEKGDQQIFLHSTSSATIINGEVRKWKGFGIQAELWTKN